MHSETLEVLKKLHRSNLNLSQLEEIYYGNRKNDRILTALLEQRALPQHFAANIIPQIPTMSLMRLEKNKRVNPGIRKSCENEFLRRYVRVAKGEKISYLKQASANMLKNFLREEDKLLLDAILNNPQCNQDLVLSLINSKKSPKSSLYEVLINTEWYKVSNIAFAISMDKNATVRILIAIIPYLSSHDLKELYLRTHRRVQEEIILYNSKKSSGK